MHVRAFGAVNPASKLCSKQDIRTGASPVHGRTPMGSPLGKRVISVVVVQDRECGVALLQRFPYK